MRRAIIHIGMPRTGSTTFQQVLANLRPELETAGILYPDLTPRSMRHAPHISHQHFGETLDGRRPNHEREELLQRLSDRLARFDGDVVILSYEDLIQQKARFGVPEILSAFFAQRGFTAEAITAVKPQSEHLNSIYTHRAQMILERRNFARFAHNYAYAARFEYDALIQPWIAAFQGRVRAVPVCDRRSGAPLVRRMFGELKLLRRVGPLLQPRHIRNVGNRSPGPVAVEISRRLRRTRTHAQLHVPPRQMMRFIEKTVGERGYDREKFNGVTPELRAALEARYYGINDRFARAVWSQQWDDVVAPEPVCAVNELAVRGIDPATEWAIVEILRLAAGQFDVTPHRSIFNQPINLLIENADNLQRRLGYSRWRVI